MNFRLNPFRKSRKNRRARTVSKPLATRNKRRLEIEFLEGRELPSASSLVAAYNFDQGSGTVLTDISGNGNNGTISNATWSTAGKFGGALKFNGSSSLVTVADAASLDLTKGMTLEAWVDPTSLNSPDGGWCAAIAKDHANSSNDISYALYAANGSGTPAAGHILVGSRDYGAQGGGVLALNQWVFLAATYDGTMLRMYVNGNLVGSKAVAGSIVTTNDPLRIGGDWSKEMFTGLIDNVRIYNQALTQSAIQTDMSTAVSSSGTTTAPAPVANAGADKSGNEGSAIALSGSATGGQGTLTYSWNFGDGATATGQSVSHAYADNGTFTATVTVTDGLGRTSSDSAVITVKNVAPTPNTGGAYTATAGTALTVSGSATDPSSADTAAGFTFAWNFGDGSTGSGQTASHTYASAGTYTITLTATDKDGGSKSATTTATVSAAPSAPPAAQPFPNNGNAPALPAPTGTVINVSTASQLQSAVANLKSGQTILIAPGTYNLTDTLWVPQGLTNVAIRGSSGKAGDVIIQGDAVISATAPYNGSAIWGSGSGISGTINFGIWLGNVQGVTIGDLTLKNFVDDAIILNAGVQSPLIHNVVMLDTGEQLLKSNPDGNGGGVNNGIVEYCTIGYSVAAPNNYTNGIDVHTGQNWVIRDNLFQNIYTTNTKTTLSGGALAGPAILVWNGSSNFTVEANTFINNQREIAFGLSDPSTITNDNSGGIIRNNMIYRSGGQHGDVAIGVWNSPNSEVAYNTVILNGDYPNAVEYRFSTTTGVKILYNLTDSAIISRDGATATVTGNITNAQKSWFVNPSVGDLHLTSAATPAINHGVLLTEVPTDYDGDTRPVGSAPDVGADEDPPAAPSGSDTTAPTVSISSPTGGSTVSGTVSISANASDNVGVASVQFFVDGNAVGSPDTAAPYTYSWDSTAIGNGNHTITAQARDAAGNSTTSAAVTATVSNTIQSPQPAPAPAPGSNANEPLLHQSNLQYVGAFRVPNVNDPLQPGDATYDYGGSALAYNPANNSLFIVGMPYDQAISEISIPQSIVNSGNLNNLATASVLQSPMQVLNKLPNNPPVQGNAGGMDIGGLMVVNGKLVGTAYAFYDANGSAVYSHFTLDSLNLSTAKAGGLYQVGTQGAGLVAGYMAPIPSEWQSALGAPYLTGQADLNIISRTSSGPAAFGFDPSQLGSTAAPTTPYVYYPSTAPLGPYSGAVDPLQSGTSQVNGVVFAPGTSSVLFWGSTGTNYDDYGEASTFGDTNRTSKGPHSLNGEYALQVWAYNANDFAAVKAGTLQPTQVQPYDVWNFDVPITTGDKQIGGVAFDQSTGRVYVSIIDADNGYAYHSLPLIEVFQVTTNPPAGTRVGAPHVGTLAATPSTDAPGPISAGTTVMLTAGNVYATASGASITQVAFYLDTNSNGVLDTSTDKLLGNGAPSTVANAGHNWTLNFSTSGMKSGTYTVFAQALDSNGVLSDPIAYTFTIQ